MNTDIDEPLNQPSKNMFTFFGGAGYLRLAIVEALQMWI